jgi:hypothetical protein
VAHRGLGPGRLDSAQLLLVVRQPHADSVLFIGFNKPNTGRLKSARQVLHRPLLWVGAFTSRNRVWLGPRRQNSWTRSYRSSTADQLSLRVSDLLTECLSRNHYEGQILCLLGHRMVDDPWWPCSGPGTRRQLGKRPGWSAARCEPDGEAGGSFASYAVENAAHTPKGAAAGPPSPNRHVAVQPYCDEAFLVGSLLAEALLARVTLRRGFSGGGSSLPNRLSKKEPPLLLLALPPLGLGLLLATPAKF